jgi:hypothetical protein
MTNIGTDEITVASTYKAALHLEQNLTADLSATATLPVKWAYFTAACDGAHTLLRWGTTNETDNSYFIVEKSTNALVWSSIGRVKGFGNSFTEQQYQFKDSTSSLTTYYRLRQVDFNGKADLSKVVVVNCEAAERRMLRVFPNPASNILQVTGADAGARYKLINAKGHAVRTGTVLSGNTSISLLNLPQGSYFLKVEGYNSQPVHVMKLAHGN